MSAPNSSSSSKKSSRKNAIGNRSDLGWEHGVDINGDSKTVKCKYCNDVFTGGIFRFKHHLACTRENVKSCTSVPDEVRKLMISILLKKTEASKKRKRDIYELEDDSVEVEEIEQFSKQKGKNTMDRFLKKTNNVQTTMNQMMKKDLREECCQQIARFFYTSAIPFNCVNNPEFSKMVNLIGRYGIGLKPPSFHEIREKYLRKEVIRINDMLEEFKIEWQKTGCSIMSDGWTDKKRRSICNFLVNSPKGTVFLCSIDTSDISKTADKVLEMLDDVVQMVGIDNVVQVVTDNASNYKLAGEMLMEKRKSLFWTPCAAHCIDLILEDFEKKLKVHRVTIAKGRKITTFIYARTMLISWLKEFTNGRDLIRPAVTRFATAYLTLGCLCELKGSLMTMFTSSKWRNSRFASLDVGKKVQSIVLDSVFWKNVALCLKAAYPLIKVLRMVDSDAKPAMGFIYESMDRAKEKIQINFGNVKRSYDPIWKIVDERWELQLHRPLHAAAYYLNPHFHYSPSFKVDVEVKSGLYQCITVMVSDVEERTKIDLQLDHFKNARGLFGIEAAKLTRTKKAPAEWWDSYGDECPELTKFAIRVLSLTCSASGCERNWSAFEMVHTKRRNRLHQKKMNDLVFVMYNLKLIERQKKREAPEYCLDDFASDDEWITEKEAPVFPLRKKGLRILDQAAESWEDSDEEEFGGTVNTTVVRDALDVEDDLVIHDVDEDDEDDIVENVVVNDNDDIEALDEELAGDPNIPEEEYDHDDCGGENDDLGEDGGAPVTNFY